MNLKYFFILTIICVYSSACSDVLDMAPDGTMSMEDVYTDPDVMEGLLNTCYNNMPAKGYEYWMFDALPVSLSDDAWSSWDGFGNVPVSEIYKGQASSSNHPVLNMGYSEGNNNADYWAKYWRQIRLCNQFLENIGTAAVKSETNRARMTAEAHVLRAYFYSELIKWFGKVPILDETIPFDADFSALRRESVYDVAKLIASDCDAALKAPELPWRITTGGDALRVTKAAAHALKSQAFLFAASPLHNQGNNYWEEAYQVCKTAVDELKSNGYELFATCTNPEVYGTYPGAAFHQLICQNGDYAANPRDKETIWQQKDTDPASAFAAHIIGLFSYIGSGMAGTVFCGTCPTQDLVDAFETTDGKPVLTLSKPYLDERHLQPNYNPDNTLYNPTDPYKNRDPRLYATALMNGDTIIWNYGEVVRVETYVGGAHHISLNQSDLAFSRTGYFHRKLVAPRTSATNSILGPNCKYFRLAELILNYAEAAAEANHLDAAKTAVDEIRARVQMPSLPSGLSQEEMILRVRNERRVELAWEGQRYFDLRRWQKPDGDLSATCKYLTGMYITRNEDGSFNYQRINPWGDIPRGGWENKNLLLPIPLNEVSRLEAVTGEKWQNPGW
ncbi:MAG: RagB/SusD family nutrient uptake outer membrane protein [Tannerella sp.]|jgi:hypothetical protein|nr:RagB/SusD family nutrient uptake outer membrane protein [Tannerella sp.]